MNPETRRSEDLRRAQALMRMPFVESIRGRLGGLVFKDGNTLVSRFPAPERVRAAAPKPAVSPDPPAVPPPAGPRIASAAVRSPR